MLSRSTCPTIASMAAAPLSPCATWLISGRALARCCAWCARAVASSAWKSATRRAKYWAPSSTCTSTDWPRSSAAFSAKPSRNITTCPIRSPLSPTRPRLKPLWKRSAGAMYISIACWAASWPYTSAQKLSKLPAFGLFALRSPNSSSIIAVLKNVHNTCSRKRSGERPMSEESNVTNGKQFDEGQEPRPEIPEAELLYEETQAALAIASSEAATTEEMATCWRFLLTGWERYLSTHELTDEFRPVLLEACRAAGFCFFNLYQQNKQSRNVDRAVEAWRKAVRLSSPDAPDLPKLLNVLSIALSQQYAHTHDLPFLDSAVEFLEQALKLTSVDSQYRLHTLNNLAAMMRLRYLHTKDLADQNRAILLYGQLVEHTPLDDLELPMYLHYLSSALIERFRVTHR